MPEEVWRIGPMWDMRQIPYIEPNVTLPKVRYGGIHQSLSGARTMDITGYRGEYGFEINWMDEVDYQFLEMLFTGQIQGPYRLLNPLKRNLLSPQATSLETSRSPKSGVILASGNMLRTYDNTFTTSPLAGVISGWSGSAPIAFDKAKATPILVGQPVTGSIYMKSSTPTTVELRLEYWKQGVFTGVFGVASVVTTSTWARYNITRTSLSDNRDGVVFSILPSTYPSPLYVAAPQVEMATSPSTWQPGGGAPVVLMDQFPVESLRFPLRNVKLTLLEA